jgi:hypothetical protein
MREIMIKDNQCYTSHATCILCSMRTNNCFYCRKQIDLIDILQETKIVATTNTDIPISYLIKEFPLLELAKLLDETILYECIVRKLFPFLYIMYLGLSIISWITLDTLNAEMTYCDNQGNCYISTMYFTYLLIKIFIVISNISALLYYDHVKTTTMFLFVLKN